MYAINKVPKYICSFGGHNRSALLFALFLTACQPVIAYANAAGTVAPVRTVLPAATVLFADTPLPDPTDSPTPSLTSTSTPTETPTISPTPGPIALPAGLGLDPADWENWPVLPVVTQRARQIYQAGQLLGNDPRAFSVFGDCQSEPDAFMGIYETDLELIDKLPSNLHETVDWFTGSFNRQSPTVRGGTTTGALLWVPWHQNKYTCTIYETPLGCELRIHKPAFVIIHVGTHYESNNHDYMRKVLDQVIAAGVVPILATKADNDELDQHVNAGYAKLAVEYAIPFWNFWAAVSELPNHGLYTRPDAKNQGDIYLIEAALEIQRSSALQVLDIVRRAVMEP